MSRAEKVMWMVCGLLVLVGLALNLKRVQIRVDQLEDQLARSAFVTRAPAATTAAKDD